MKLFKKMKDGGPDSPVDGYFLIEIKSLFSIVLLKFNRGGREKFHTHAFNAWTWFLLGCLVEEEANGTTKPYYRSIFPKKTKKDKNHRVFAFIDSWCLSIRGPWENTWTEYDERENKTTTLSKGRKIIGERYERI